MPRMTRIELFATTVFACTSFTSLASTSTPRLQYIAVGIVTYLADHGPCSYYTPFSNSTMGQYYHISTNKTILFYDDGTCIEQALRAIAQFGIHWDSKPVEFNIGANHCVAANCNFAAVLNITTG